MNLYYRIADHVVSVIVSSKSEVFDNLPAFSSFLYEPDSEEIVGRLLEISLEAELERPDEETHCFDWEGTRCSIFQEKEGYLVELVQIHTGRKELMRSTSDWREVKTTLRPGQADFGFFLSYFIMMSYSFASASFKTLMMHASVIESDGKGILFLGKSGTGKSTHTGLWLKYMPGTSLLNDDNPIVRLFPDGSVRVYGSPWSGKTPCYHNRSVPVAGFVRLKQAPENRLQRLAPAQAFAALLPSCSNMVWDKKIHDSVCLTVAEIIPQSKVCLLNCLPNSGAVALSNTLIYETSYSK
ncbi:MAG: hypothetical protein RR346_03225 [Bacteroidales bacterium]